MKRKSPLLILFTILSLVVRAQNIDTVVVKTITFTGEQWAWLIGNYTNVNVDSSSASVFRFIRDKIRTANPPTWTTNVTVDSLPGRIYLDFYKTVKTANAGEIVSRYTSMVNAMRTKTNMLSWFDAFDAIMDADFNRKRDAGKHIVMDN
jgi:hypothetical protein